MKSFKQHLLESWKKYRLRQQLQTVNSYNRNPWDQSATDTVNKRLRRFLYSRKTSESQKDMADRKYLLQSAQRIARETGERIDPSNKENVSGYYNKFVDRSDAQWLTAANLPKERKNREIFLRRRIQRLKKAK